MSNKLREPNPNYPDRELAPEDRTRIVVCERSGGDEAIEMAYENVLQEAKNGLRGVRKPPAPKPPPMPLHPVTLTDASIVTSQSPPPSPPRSWTEGSETKKALRGFSV